MSTPKHILVGTDLSEGADAALEYATTLASALGARLTVVLALESAYPYPVPWDPPIKLRLELEQRCAALRSRGADVRAVLREGPPWRELLSTAEETGAELIVVGTHGRQGLPRFILGSVAERVVRLSPVPVMTVRS